ncbi:MAG: nucleoside 2-deoxyribosyltransferase [Syntrophobacteraceae bacterium]
MKIYLAGPLFSEAERDWMKKLKGRIESLANVSANKVQVIWPYELITAEAIMALGQSAKFEIFSRCKSYLEDSDLVIALLDGPQVDDGTALEIGYYRALRKGKIIGIRTDFRRARESEGAKVNAMIECSCDWIVNSAIETLERIKQKI